MRVYSDFLFPVGLTGMFLAFLYATDAMGFFVYQCILVIYGLGASVLWGPPVEIDR